MPRWKIHENSSLVTLDDEFVKGQMMSVNDETSMWNVCI